jgi:transposase-like protein
VPAAPKISAQAEATIIARHAAGEPLRAIAPDCGVSHQALSKRLKRARQRQQEQPEPQPQLAAEPANERSPALEPPQPARPSPSINPAQRDSPQGLIRLRRGAEIRWVDPIDESERHQQLLAEGFTA